MMMMMMTGVVLKPVAQQPLVVLSHTYYVLLASCCPLGEAPSEKARVVASVVKKLVFTQQIIGGGVVNKD